MARCLRCKAGNEWIEGDVKPEPAGMVCIPLDLAQFVRKVWLPANPNKLRSAAPETIAAAKAFIAAVENATIDSGKAQP